MSDLLVCLDLGQTTDPTALAILDREMVSMGSKLLPRFLVRHLERLPLQTPYPVIVEGVKARIDTLRNDMRSLFPGDPQRKVQLIVDQTGVGRPVVDMLRAARLVPVGVSITTGEVSRQVNDHWDEWHLAKRQLIMTFQVTLQQGRFRVARGLELAETLAKEAQNFEWRPNKRQDDSLYAAWREGTHDDLLFACALGVWWGTLYCPDLSISTSGKQHAKATGNPLMQRGIRGFKRSA